MAEMLEFKSKKYNSAAALPLSGPDQNVIGALTELRQHTENINSQPSLIFKNGVYRGRDKDEVQTVVLPGWEFGYRVKDLGNGVMQRRVFIKCRDEKLSDIPDAQLNPILIAVFETCIDIAEGFPDMEYVADDCILMTQNFMPVFLVENNSLVVPGGNGA